MPVTDPVADSPSGPNPLSGREQVVLLRQLRRAARHQDQTIAQTALDTLNDPDMFLVLSQHIAANVPPSPTPKQHPWLQWLLQALPAIISFFMTIFGAGKIPPLPPLPPFPTPSPTPGGDSPAPGGGGPPPFNPQLPGEAMGFALPTWAMQLALSELIALVKKAVPEIVSHLPAWEAQVEALLRKYLGPQPAMAVPMGFTLPGWAAKGILSELTQILQNAIPEISARLPVWESAVEALLKKYLGA